MLFNSVALYPLPAGLGPHLGITSLNIVGNDLTDTVCGHVPGTNGGGDPLWPPLDQGNPDGRHPKDWLSS